MKAMNYTLNWGWGWGKR